MNTSDANPDQVSRDFEERRLRHVITTIAQQLNQKHESVSESKRALSGIGRKDYTAGTIVAWKYATDSARLEILTSMQDAPYFGRIDFVEDALKERELIYIGTSTLCDRCEDPLVHDWRAPICSMYYQFGPGPATFDAPMGKISGNLLLKRSYTISDGNLVTIHDAAEPSQQGDGQPVDAMLLTLLGRNTTGQMRQIVQSIQAEQDAAIRSEGELVIIHGPAGSGKTIIALHRAAYLLYHLRIQKERNKQNYGWVSANQMMVFSPNNVFAEYISQVLPDLHETTIRQVVVDRMLEDELRKRLRISDKSTNFTVETRDQQFEYAIGGTSQPDHRLRMAGAVLKNSTAMVEAAERFIEQQDEVISAAFDDIPDPTQADGEAFYGKDEMQRIFDSKSANLPVADRVNAVIAELNTRIKTFAGREYAQLRDTRQLQESAQRLATRLGRYRDAGILQLYRHFWNRPDNLGLESKAPLDTYWIGRAAQRTHEGLAARSILYEDIAPMLLLDGLWHGFPVYTDVQHAVIDEAQDYSPACYEFLRRSLPDQTTYTVVGDINQRANTLTGLRSFDDLSKIIPLRTTRVELSRSYRSSAEITDFATRIIADLPAVENVRRTGVKPLLVKLSSVAVEPHILKNLVDQIRGRGNKSIAIICKTQAESEVLFGNLKLILNVELITPKSTSKLQGTVVAPVFYAKGLEFDAVIVHDASADNYCRVEERNVSYVACTRALHELYMCFSGEPSGLLPVDSPDLWEYYVPS